jgi:hypothetical protein
VQIALDWLQIERADLEEKLAGVGEGFEEIRRQFGLPDRGAAEALAALLSGAATSSREEMP